MQKPSDATKDIYTRLDGKLLSEFESVKRHHGIRSNSETVRFLIRQEARRVAQDGPIVHAGHPSPA